MDGFPKAVMEGKQKEVKTEGERREMKGEGIQLVCKIVTPDKRSAPTW